jgi:hypothetical protein
MRNGQSWRTITTTLAVLAAVSCGGDDPKGDADGDETGTGDDNATGMKFDVIGHSDTPYNPGDCSDGEGGGNGEGEFEFSYIWIANSPQGTVSKIDTQTGVEEGRYRTGPDDPDPSRTSVNQFGDAAVANRSGSVTKIIADVEDCEDQNNNGFQTSTGPNDILAWGEDDCVVWHRHLVDVEMNQHGPRPIAWEATDPEAGTCNYPPPRLWVGWWQDPSGDVGVFHRLDGASGETVDMVEVPTWNWGDKQTGPYGGAVTSDGDFWVTGYYGPAIKIDAVSLDVTYYDPLPDSGYYGMSLDANERVWVGGCDGKIYHLDPFGNDTPEEIATIEGRARGVQVDREGRAWFAGNNPCRLLMVDVTTKQLVEDAIPLPGCQMPVGVSIDVEGYVWVVDRDAEKAYKVDPDTYQVELEVTGLIEPYTYSDMTGAALNLVENPPQG